MDEVIIGIGILVVIGCAFWLIIPYLLSRYKRVDSAQHKDESDEKNNIPD